MSARTTTMWWPLPLLLLLAAMCCGLEEDAVHTYTRLVGHIATKLRNGGNCHDGSQMVDNAPLCATIQKCIDDTALADNALCSALLDADNVVQDASNATEAVQKPSIGAVWGFGFLSVTIISLTSVLGVVVLPFMSKSFYNTLLSALIGLAVGSLSGSAMFHLIPSAFSLADISFFSHHSYLNISFVIWLGIYMFFIVERILKIIMQYRSISGTVSIPVHGHAHGHAHSGVDGVNGVARRASAFSAETKATDRDAELSQSLFSPTTPLNDESAIIHRPAASITADTRSRGSTAAGSPIATVAWMIIFGDGVHNFIDGLSIGAAFTESILTGISVSMAVLCEEFPHELGDFAVLLNAGMTMRQAMLYNFLSACTCYVGLVLGILLGGMQFGNEYIFALAGGMFLYIALVDMIPELNDATDEAGRLSLVSSVKMFCIQNVGIVLGIVSLYVLARYQGDIQIGNL